MVAEQAASTCTLSTINHVSRYLASTRDLALIYRRPEEPTAPVVWTDSSYAPNYGKRHDSTPLPGGEFSTSTASTSASA